MNKKVLAMVAAGCLILGMVVLVASLGQLGAVRWNGLTYQLITVAMIPVYALMSFVTPGRKRRR